MPENHHRGTSAPTLGTDCALPSFRRRSWPGELMAVVADSARTHLRELWSFHRVGSALPLPSLRPLRGWRAERAHPIVGQPCVPVSTTGACGHARSRRRKGVQFETMAGCIIARSSVLGKRETEVVFVERIVDTGQVMTENVEARAKGMWLNLER